MKRRIAMTSGVIAVVVAASVLVAAEAGAAQRVSQAGCKPSVAKPATRALASSQRLPSIQLVAGYSVLDQMQGSLVGTWTTEVDWSSFQYNQASGVMKFEVSEAFTGTVNRIGSGSDTLFFKGYVVQRFKPGTPLGPGDPTNPAPGTTDDAGMWIGGSCLHPITGGTGAFQGATGAIYFRDIHYFYDSNYWGIIRLRAGS
ncbi:MAG TPA: hypothetical protein VJ689_09600 [Gaiellaceae bacterium]|jgi:hypothetical protein|nr:hypothetical protein [Gaiellaceae bacterium]